MKIQMLFVAQHIGFAGLLSWAVICPVYAQGGQVREIGLAPASKSSDTAVQTSSVVLPFPISITEPGNYRLNTNLSGGGRGAISIESSDVTLDLNGFSVTAIGNVIVATGFNNVAILNGTIGGGEEAIIAGSNCRVEKLRIAGGADGMSLGTNCIVKDNTVQAAHTGIVCSGCVVSGNTVSTISDVAIGVANSSLVVGNTATSTGNIALVADDTTGYAQNVLHGNQADVSGGVQIGQNLCVTSKICPP